jgi:glutathione S-transferase
MLDLKGIDYDLVEVLPGTQRVHLRLARFRHGTVPALEIDGRRNLGSRRNSRALDGLQPEPALFPADPERRRAIEAAERWGDEELQSVPRRILRWGMVRDVDLRIWLAQLNPRAPAPAAMARLSGPVARYYAWVVHAETDRVRRDVAQLPSMLGRVDELVSERVISLEHPNAATFQVLCTVRALLGFADFEHEVGVRSSAPMARKLFPHFPAALVPPFVDRLGLR